MSETSRTSGRLFNLDGLSSRLPRPLGSVVRSPLESLLCFPKLNALYDARTDWQYASAVEFMEQVLNTFKLNVRVSRHDIHRIPTSGPMIAVANHPYGALEGMVLMSLLARVRPDVRIMANHLLGHVPEMRPLFIFVDPFENETSPKANIRGLKEAMRWLHDGHAMGVFPAGEVSHLNLRERRIMERDWTPHIAALARKCKATVVPIYFSGQNSPIFHMAGLIHPRLRTALLPREVFNKRETTVRIRVGTPVSPERMQAFMSDRKAILYLQLRSDVLRERKGVVRRRSDQTRSLLRLPLRRRTPRMAPLAAAQPPAAIQDDLRALSPDALLASNGAMQAYIARAPAIPSILNELGRLREIAFRAVGEGSGKARDLDRFDADYHHLFLWDQEHERLAGAYRLGLSEELLRDGDMSRFYASTLFRISPGLLQATGPTIELGRSFIAPRYQRNFTPLMLLWKGIGGFMARQPRYRHLLGPVTISNDYKKISKALMVRFLSRPQYCSPLAHLVTPRKPFPMRRYGRAGVMRLARMVRDARELGDVIRDIEPDTKGLPVLIKQYLNLGARALGFNVDPDFGYCLDCLCLFDVALTERRVLDRYMGREHTETFLRYHGM